MGQEEDACISTTENGLYFFRFRDPDARDWVMEYGPWHLTGRPFILCAWQPYMDMLNIQLTSIPIWVKFYNIPLEYWTNTSLGCISSVAGNPLHLDSLTENQSKLSFARICIEVGVDCEFPKSILLDMGNGKYSTIRIEYPWAPQCCSNCKLFGYNLVHYHIVKGQNSKHDTTKSGNSVNEDGEEIIMAYARKASLVMGAGSRKDSTGVTLVNATDSVVDSIADGRGATKLTVTCTGEVNGANTGVDDHPKLQGNTFECLAQSEEECPSEVANNSDTSRSNPNISADFSDTSPTFETFKHIKRIDELDYTPVPLSKTKLKKLKKRKKVSKQAPVVRGSIHYSNG